MLIQKFDEDGNDKSELESSVHELFIKRGTTLSDSSNISKQLVNPVLQGL